MKSPAIDAKNEYHNLDSPIVRRGGLSNVTHRQTMKEASTSDAMTAKATVALRLPRKARTEDATEHRIAAAAKYMNQLMHEFRDIPTQHDRLCFALASYNGGSFHVRDAMALAKKYGHSPQHWGDVRQYILKLTDAKYYTDPVNDKVLKNKNSIKDLEEVKQTVEPEQKEQEIFVCAWVRTNRAQAQFGFLNVIGSQS